MKEFLRQHPLPIFFLLAFAGFWAFLALNRVPQFHFWAPFLGVFAPAVAALSMTGADEGETGVRQLLSKLGAWRVPPQWYVVAIGLPLAQALLAIGLAAAFHKYKGISIEAMRPVLPATWVFFLFAAGEELGWRGYALPRLFVRWRALYASLILGALHSAWHWPLILPSHGLMGDLPLLPWTAAVVTEAIVFTWLYLGTRGSVLLVVLYHGMVNACMLLFNAIDAGWMPWIKSGICIVTGAVLLLASGPDLGQRETRARSASAIH